MRTGKHDNLLERLRNPDKKVRKAAADEVYDMELGNLPSSQELLAVLDKDDISIRWHIFYVLRKLKDPAAVPDLISLLTAPENDKRFWAAEILGAIENPEPAPHLLKVLKALQEPDAWVRESVVNALGRIRAREAIPALIDLLDDPHGDVRGTAAWALGEMSASKAVPKLIELLSDYTKTMIREEIKTVSDAAAYALTMIATPEATEALQKRL